MPFAHRTRFLQSRNSLHGRPNGRPTWVAASQGATAAAGSASLGGVYIKDLAASDMASYERALDLMQLGGIQKLTAMQLIEGIEVEQRGNEVAVRFLTGGPPPSRSVQLCGGRLATASPPHASPRSRPRSGAFLQGH